MKDCSLNAIEAEASSLSFGNFADLWLDMKRDQKLSGSTLDNYTSSTNKYLLPGLERMLLENISWEHVNGIIQNCKENGLGAGRINLTLRILKQMFNDAVQLNYLKENPLPPIKPIKERPKSLNYWLPEQVKRFLKANSDNPLHPMFVVALNTGLRRGELLGLCWDKVNLKKKWIEVARIRDRYGLRDTTKTGTVRYVPLNDAACKALRKLSQNRKDERLVFTLNGAIPSVGHLSNYCFHKALETADVPKIRFHDLRTTYASNFAMAGGDIFALSKLLGHTSVEMTTKKYAGLHPKFMKKAVQTIQFE